MESTCKDNLIKCLGQDCSTLVQGDYVIHLSRDACGKCDISLVSFSPSGADCTLVTNCINTNTATQTAIRNLLISLINSDAIVQSAICGVNCGPSIPSNVTDITSTDSNGGAYDCGNPILNWTASSGATSYDVFEGATLLGNTVSTTFTVVGASVGSHTYLVVAKNVSGSASGVSTTVNVVACLTAPGNVTGTINVYDTGTATNYTCGLGFDVNFTDVSGATYYQLFEGATQIGSNSSTSNFAVTGQTAGSHTYTIIACNGVGCSTGTNFTVTLASCVASKAVDLTGQTFNNGTKNSTDNTGRVMFPIQFNDIGLAIANNNPGYTSCGVGTFYSDINGGFIPPVTGTYTFNFGAYIQSPNCNGATGWNMEVAVHPVGLGNGVLSGVNRQSTILKNCGDTSFTPMTWTGNLNAGTCYNIYVGGFNVGGNAQTTGAVINNLIIS